MRDVILKQWEQILHSIAATKDVQLKGHFNGVVLCGMGGSALPGDLLNALQVMKVPLVVHRGYGLPKIFAARPLIIASSYSGNTEETLSSYLRAKEMGYPVFISASGGELLARAEKDAVPLSRILYRDMEPRHTFLAAFSGIATVLGHGSEVIMGLREELLGAAHFLKTVIPGLEQFGKILADELKGKTPVYVSSPSLSFAAHNFKIQTNENAKTPAFWNVIPELNHNEMLGFMNPQGVFRVVMLRDQHDDPRVLKRMEVTAELYKKWGVEVSFFDVQGENLLQKILYAVVFGLWTTYYLALQYGVDPIPVHAVEEFKRKLKTED